VTALGLARFALLLASLATAGATAWVLAQNPFAEVFVERGTEEVRAGFARAVAGVVDEDWLLPRLEAALESGDPGEVEVLVRLADDAGVALPEGMREDAERAAAHSTGVVACAACAWDIGACTRLAQVAACNLTVEVTPLGDLNAVRRGLRDHLADTPVDRVDLGLGLLGLGATGAVVASGGTSLPLKAGATVLRVARRAGTMTPGLRAAVDDAVIGAVRWENAGRVALLEAAPATMIDTARTGRIAAVAGDALRLGRNTSPADGLALMRLADDPAELAGLARLSDAAGEATRPGVRALGKSRALRLTTRVSDIFLAALGLVTLLVAQLGSLLLFLLRRALVRR